MQWRLSLDMGSNSLGWWAYRLSNSGSSSNPYWQPVESLDGGVYIFPEGRESSKKGRVGDSNAVARRNARGMRRNRDRGRHRMQHFIQNLIKLGLLPADKKVREALFQTPKNTVLETDANNPYRLRAEALSRTLSPYELGRALGHLGLRRGFKSNRKEASDEDGGLLKDKIEALKATMGNQTLGQYLWDAYQTEYEKEKAGHSRQGIRFRGEKDLYPERAMFEHEFGEIRARQAPHHTLTEQDWNNLRDNSILFQHPLRPVERGRCEFFPKETRHWKDTPIAHDARVYQELNNLKWRDDYFVFHTLDKDQRSQVLATLMTRKSPVTFASLRKLKRKDKTPLFAKGSVFNLEDAKRKSLNPHKVAAVFSADEDLSPLWHHRVQHEDGQLDDVFEILHSAVDDDKARADLKQHFSLSDEVIAKLIAYRLSDGTVNVSRRFMEQLVPILADQGLGYAEAVTYLTDDEGNPLHHSLRDDGVRYDELPYYGEVLSGSMLGADPSKDAKKFPEQHFGKINNPTVHVALNSVRRLVNILSQKFGKAPHDIHVELTRDLKLPKLLRNDINKQQAANQRENERIKKLCAANNMPNPSGLDLKKVKLWEELDKNMVSRRCVFSGKPISFAQLFNGDVEIEHILPFSRTLDNGMGNLTVSFREANRFKGNRTPYEAFHGDPHNGAAQYVWDDILQRGETLPKFKRGRFAPTAMEVFEKENGFIARQLTDTAYMTRAATRYLKALKGVEAVRANPGRLTAMVRGKWGFNGILNDDNQKTREDHRHHAIDAAVVGLIDHRVLAEISRLTARGADDLVRIALPDLNPDLRKAIRTRVPEIITVFRPDHGLNGKMYNETAYGFVGEDQRDEKNPSYNLVTRKPLPELTVTQCGTIRDLKLREQVHIALAQAKAKGTKHETALMAFSEQNGIKRARVLMANKSVKRISTAPYKGYAVGTYVCCDIWQIPPKKKKSGKFGLPTWEGQFWTYADAQNPGTSGFCKDNPKASTWPGKHPGAKFVTRLFKNDLVAYDEGGKMQVMRVAGYSTTDNRLDLRLHSAANAPQAYVGINVLGPKNLRRLYVTPDGRVLENKRNARLNKGVS